MKLEQRMTEEGMLFLHGAHQSVHILGLSESEKEERRRIHAAKETDFLRLRRTKLSVVDFHSLKVIGRGAFGEVSSSAKRGTASQ